MYTPSTVLPYLLFLTPTMPVPSGQCGSEPISTGYSMTIIVSGETRGARNLGGDFVEKEND